MTEQELAQRLLYNRMKTVVARGDRVLKQKSEGYVYFVQCDAFVKIGHSLEPRRRIGHIATNSPHECTLIGMAAGGNRLEKELHAKFAEHRHRGEWFRLTPELLKVIKSIIEPV